MNFISERRTGIKMRYYFKDNKWTAVANSHAKYWEEKGYGDCPVLDLFLPMNETFGWEKDKGGYKQKSMTTGEMVEHLLQKKIRYQAFIHNIDRIIERAGKLIP